MNRKSKTMSRRPSRRRQSMKRLSEQELKDIAWLLRYLRNDPNSGLITRCACDAIDKLVDNHKVEAAISSASKRNPI